ncbi:MAG: amidophosphoribosyltransferase [Deltaproteobacteria bacterium]|nr:amidophosphoribosyltransferase [Deltaproteobacteria bacterium]MBI2342209.1 amidophosphoribosyltransferase [Deltaproteobacteria bacterium]MBI2974320.1 amidophosphoribosyltransferase [Deltaproteobacteria bacterium]
MCGIVGIYNHAEASNLAYLCLYAMQHRGQESGGIVTSEDGTFHQYREMGLINDIFTRDVLTKLPGNIAIGHVRYSTSGDSSLKNAYPFVIKYAHGWLAVAHNGNLTNYKKLRSELEKEGSIFQATVDSEVVMHLLAKGGAAPLEERLIKALQRIKGSYSFVFLYEDGLIAARDPKGFRPLVIGELQHNGQKTHVVVSETCALDLIGAKLVREIEPGEIVILEKGTVRNIKPFTPAKKRAQCIFEYIYFARPDSNVFGRDVYVMRTGFGRALAREHPVKADIVVPVPDSGVPAAIGYSEESGIPFQMGLIRNHYVGRTFIEPKKEIRHFGVKIKLNPVRGVLEGKRVVCVDDSIVRGTTSQKIVKMLKDSGAKEVHMRISAPPTVWPCFYGIDTPTREELIASSKSVEEIREFIGADSLAYLSQESLYWFEKTSPREWFCDACFTGDYPEELDDMPEIEKMAKKTS